MSSAAPSDMLVSRHPINFLRGWPAPSLLPASLLSSATQTVLQKQTEYTEYLEYGADEGLTRLRKGIAKWTAAHYGTTEDAERITITGGASQNLACILQSFSDPNATRAVWIVAPCYFLASGIFEDAGFAGRLKAVPEDEEGVDIEEFERRIAAFEAEDAKVEHGKPFKNFAPDRKMYRHLIYCVPTSSNPSGKTMTLRRREALVKLAQKHDALIVSDDVYDFLQWPVGDATETKVLPRLCDLDIPGDDGFGHTISNASFSKIAAPGVRTGWIEAAPKLAAGLARTASTMSGGCPSQLCSAMLSELLDTGALQKYVDEELVPGLKRRHALLSDAVATYLGPLGVTARESCLTGHASYGGYFVWVDVSSVGFPAHVIAEVAKNEDNIVVGYGNMFAVKGDEKAAVFDDHIRLCFAWLSEEDLVDGVKRLGLTMARMHGNKEKYTAVAAASTTGGDAQDR